MKGIAVMLVSLLMVASTSLKAETLQDCLLENLKGVTSDLAAEAITKACNDKFASTANSTSAENPAESVIPTGKITLTLNKSLFADKASTYEIPVPEGNWKKVGEWKQHRVQPPLFEEIWVDVKDNKMRNMVWAIYNKSANQNGWKVSKLCDRVNLHHIVRIENRGGGKQNCYGVNHWRISGGKGKNKAENQAKDWARQNNIQFPTTVITEFHRFANKRYFEVRIGYNPEFDGFPPPVDSNWSSNDWHQDRIIGNAERQAYIEKIKQSSEQIHPVLEGQFEF